MNDDDKPTRLDRIHDDIAPGEIRFGFLSRPRLDLNPDYLKNICDKCLGFTDAHTPLFACKCEKT